MNAYKRHFYKAQEVDSLRAAKHVLPIVLNLIRPKSIIDVGCGLGTWLSVCIEQGIQDVTGVDGDYVPKDMLRIPHDRFLVADLSKPLSLERKYDLVMALEVAEHIPGEFERLFVKSLTDLGPVVLFAAGVPMRSGHGHVNEQWQSHWVAIFSERSYSVLDYVRPKIWDDREIMWWYAQDTLLFIDRSWMSEHPILQSEWEHRSHTILDIVHPRLFEEVIDPRRMSIRKALKGTVYGVGRMVRAALGRRH